MPYDALALGHAALSDDDRFVAIFNWTTGQSLSIVDVEHRQLTADIATPGCSLVYAAGPRRFVSLCGDGAVLSITLDDDGHEAGRTRSEPFFDPQADPVTEKAVRYGNQWLFVSFEGKVHPVDVSGPNRDFDDEPRVAISASGEAVAVWDYYNGSHYVVQAARRPAGVPWPVRRLDQRRRGVCPCIARHDFPAAR